MKKFFTVLLALTCLYPAFSQQYGYKWRFGASAGTTNYFGDIRPLGINNFDQFTKLYKRYTHYSENLSYQISAEYALGNSVGLMLTAGSYQFGSGDRFVQNDGTLFLEGQNFDRALNFQTNLYDAGLSFVFKPDNNRILSGNSFFAPYFVLGLGYQTFNVFGDLLDADGNPYDYTDPEVIPDGTFETSLRELETELDGGYKKGTLYAHLGLGFRFRVAEGIEIFAQSDFKRAATDYLDDVSGVYRSSYVSDFQEYAAKPGTNVAGPGDNRGLENRRGDWYIYHGIGVKFSLGARKESFVPPVVSQRYTFVPSALSKQQMAESDSAQTIKASGVTNNYFTVIQLPSWTANQAWKDSTALDSASMAQLVSLQDSLGRERERLQAEILRSQQALQEYDETIAMARRDTLVSQEVTATRISGLENSRSTEMGKMTSLNSLDSQIQFKMDSLRAIQRQGQTQVLDSAALSRELLIYPGQVSRIMYSGSGQTQLYLDSTTTKSSASARSVDGNMTRDEFEEEMDKFRSEMLQAQAKRDSAMIMAFASKIPEQREYEPVQPEAQEIQVNTEAMDDKTAKKLEKNRKKQEKLEKKNNELLKDALLVGGTAAATSAINNSGDKKEDAAQAKQDSLFRAQILQDSLLIDSLQTELANRPTANESVVRDTVVNEKVVLLNSSKVEIYFGVNQADVSETEKAKLNQIKGILDRDPEMKVELVGFADNTGSVSYNLQISKKRVDSVKAYLISQGIPESKILTDVGGLILRGTSKGSVDQDRKVEVRLHESD
ncbi:OmpA family protein [Algoriphagus confluentis]|uniref:OmpA-like domain-containing protein n=1 Tax=Algoriphagus confluentis TaxID=1697556 RepID=A0ABQ6PQV2_9BACT|nr:hypothetical protein Aconfl_25500 [Algoriphagus confluentis]